MRAIFIRHGESTGNVGIPCLDLSLPGLTDKGWLQAKAIAANWTEAPSLIVVSPYLRTQQTARPTIERFPDVPVEVWPIQEFTYLEPSRWNGTTSAERLPSIEDYWERADPEYCDGPGAESFRSLMRRAEDALARLQAVDHKTLIYLFAHGQFMQAIRSLVTDAQIAERNRMLTFWRKDSPPVIGNGELVCFTSEGGKWLHQ